MSTRTHTRAAPGRARERKARRSRWPVVAGAVVVLIVLAIAAVWFFGRSEPVEVIAAPPDDAAEDSRQTAYLHTER